MFFVLNVINRTIKNFQNSCIKMLKNVTYLLRRSIVRHYSLNLLKNDIYIVSAVRTPTVNYELMKISQLAALVIDESLKRATVPYAEINEVLMNATIEPGEKEMLHEAVKTVGLKMRTKHNRIECIEDWKYAIECLQRANGCCMMLGDVHRQFESMRPNFGLRGNKLASGGVGHKYATDIIPISVRRDNEEVKIQTDDYEPVKECGGAAAVVLAGGAAAKRLGLSPLARLVGFEVADESNQAVENLMSRANLSSDQISTFNAINSSTTHVLAYLTHALLPGSYGCAVIDSEADLAKALLIEKLNPTINLNSNSNRPQLTLYTKTYCPLCDEMVAELEENFANKYDLKKIYIDKKQNVRFLRLYRKDIPVLFLNGEFLCMHKLKADLLAHKLNLLQLKNDQIAQ